MHLLDEYDIKYFTFLVALFVFMEDNLCVSDEMLVFVLRVTRFGRLKFGSPRSAQCQKGVPFKYFPCLRDRAIILCVISLSSI